MAAKFLVSARATRKREVSPRVVAEAFRPRPHLSGLWTKFEAGTDDAPFPCDVCNVGRVDGDDLADMLPSLIAATEASYEAAELGYHLEDRVALAEGGAL